MKPALISFSQLELRLIDTASLATQSTLIYYQLFAKKSYVWLAYVPLGASYGNQNIQILGLIYALSVLAYFIAIFNRPRSRTTLIILALTLALLVVDWYQGDPLRTYSLVSSSSIILAIASLVLFLLRQYTSNTND